MSTYIAQPMRVTIMGIQAYEVPNGRIRPRKCYVELTLGEDVKKTAIAERGDAPSWDDVIRFDTDGFCNLELHLYAHHRIRHEGYIGGIKEDCDPQELTKDVERNLYNYDAKGNRKDLQTVIKFTVSICPAQTDGVARPPLMASRTTKWEPLLANIAHLTRIVDNIVEVHPYAKMAWGVLSATHKMIIAQTSRDKKINHLVGIMNDVFAFVHEAEALQKIDSHRQILVQMAEHTVICAYFIRGYAKNRNFWARAIKHFVSDVDDIIKQYEDRFKELQAAFQNRVTLGVAIAALDIKDALNNLASEPAFKDVLYARGAMRIIQNDHHSKDNSEI